MVYAGIGLALADFDSVYGHYLIVLVIMDKMYLMMSWRSFLFEMRPQDVMLLYALNFIMF